MIPNLRLICSDKNMNKGCEKAVFKTFDKICQTDRRCDLKSYCKQRCYILTIKQESPCFICAETNEKMCIAFFFCLNQHTAL